MERDGPQAHDRALRRAHRLLVRHHPPSKFNLFIEQTKNVWAELLDMRKRFEPKAEEFARKYGLAPYAMFIGSGAL